LFAWITARRSLSSSVARLNWWSDMWESVKGEGRGGQDLRLRSVTRKDE